MVQLSRGKPQQPGQVFNFEAWYAELELPGDAYDSGVLKRAVQRSADAEISAGEVDYLEKPQSSFRIGLQMAEILVDFKVDSDAFVAALLYRQVRKERMSLDAVQQEFGEAVSALIYGVQRMAMISQISDDPTLS